MSDSPHFCLVPCNPIVGDVWECDCGQYLLAQDNPISGLIDYSPISTLKAKLILRKRGKLNGHE